MSLVSEPNINQLLLKWKKNTPMTTAWLEKEGYSAQLLKRYKESGWIESLGHGVYGLKEQDVQWTGALYALQTQLSLPLYPGGITALEWSGQSHFLGLGNRPFFLFGVARKRLPLWFRQLIDPLNMVILEAGALSRIDQDKNTRVYGDFELKYSVPEEAFLELLYSVPKYISFPEARQIVENLTLLRPTLLQKLLEESNSIKVCRMALYLGEYFKHDWMNKLSPEKIDLGSGKRVIHPGGVLNTKYGITVPPEDREDEPFV